MQRIDIDDRYDLSEPLGAGGMAEVYLAHDTMLGRDVALKVLREQYADAEEFVERFRREARSAAALSHPNIVPVYDRGEPEGDPGTHYIAMEYVPGGTLKEYIESKGPLEPGKAAAVAAQISSALEAAYEQGVVHRDIKPQNVLVTETGDVKVADFGIARAASTVENSQEISHTSRVMGTATYMAPEQALGEAATPRSDLYSLGVTLYEMLTGALPFTGESPVAVSKKHVGEPPRPPAEVDPGIPEAMSALVMKLLSKDPADRYSSAAETEDVLRRVGDGLPAASAVANSATGGAGGVAGAADEAGQVFAGSSASPAVPARVTRPRSRKLIPLLVALASLGAILSLGLLWEPGEGGVIGSLEGVPGAGAINEARELGEAGQASLGLEEAEIPDVEGLTEEEARERLAAVGFGAEIRPRSSSEEEAGRVLEQSAPGGREAERGSRILLAVGEGPRQAEVPALAGLGYPEVGDTLEEADLTAGGRYEAPSASAPVGAIVEQGIPAGETVKPGTAVNLTVSSGPANTGSTSASGQSAPAQGSAPGNPSQSAEGNGVGGGSGAEGSNSPWSASYGDDVEEESTDTGESTASPPDVGEQDAPAPAAPARRSSASAPATQDPSYPEEPPSSPIPYQAPQEASPPAGGGSAEAGGASPPQGTEPEGEKAPTITPTIKPIEELAPTAPDTPPPPEPTQTPTPGEDQYGR